MKKLTFILAIASVLIYGCSKEETMPASDSQQVEASGISAYVLKLDGNSPVWEFTSLSIAESNSGSATLKQGNSAHTHGNFHGFGESVSFSGTQNNGGTHGSAEIQLSANGGNLHIKMETASVVVLGNDENEAVYGGLITEVIENTLPPPPPPPPGFPPPSCNTFDLGTYVYFVVKDNGQGNNAPADQYRSVIYPRCTALSDGGATFPWFIFGWTDVTDPSDKIKVNN